MYHYNDRFYESNCDSCKQEFRSLTIREMKTLEEFHECGISTESVVYADDYLVEFVPTAEFTTPMFTTKRF
jgi:hypothetical protein